MWASQRHLQALVAMEIKSKDSINFSQTSNLSINLYKKIGSSWFRPAHGSSNGIGRISGETYQGTIRQISFNNGT